MNGGIFPSEFRSGPPANFNELYHQFRFTGNALPEDVMIEICLLDEDHGPTDTLHKFASSRRSLWAHGLP